MNIKKIILVILIVFISMNFLGCTLGESTEKNKTDEKNEARENLENILYNKIKIDNQNNVEEDIELIYNIEYENKKYNVNWTSNNEHVVNANGEVNRQDEHKFVELSAKIEGFDRNKKFDLIVIKNLTLLEESKRNFNLNDINLEIYNDIELPNTYNFNNKVYNVSYTSDKMSISNTGNFTAPNQDEIVTITATVNMETHTFSKNFKFVAKANKVYTNYISDLIFSSYIEGSNYNKAFQIYNGTGQVIVLNNYKIKFLHNMENDYYINLSGKINHNESISFIYNNESNNIIDSINRNIKFDVNTNGDDIIELYKNTSNEEILIDAIGSKNYLSKNINGLKDITLNRKSDISNPNANFDILEWDPYEKDTNNLESMIFNVFSDGDVDKISPNISLVNNKTTNVYQGFEEIDFASYFNIKDNFDETVDFSSAVMSLDKQLDKYLLDTYQISYFISDNAGNFSAYKLKINIVSEGKIPLSDAAIKYYENIGDLTGVDLKKALNGLISNHNTFPYTIDDIDTWDILKDVDEDPNNPNNILGIYSNLSIPKGCQDTVNPPDYCNGIEWNREHVWSKSRGDFGEMPPAGTDIHHLFAEEKIMNSIKNNRFFTSCNEENDYNVVDREYGNYTCNEWHFEPRDEIKGDVARIIFYMAVRYEGENGEVDLEIFNNNDYDTSKSSKNPYYGDLNVLLMWHLLDPVSEREVVRNEKVFGYQGNRNPFIDYPEFVEKIFQ